MDIRRNFDRIMMDGHSRGDEEVLDTLVAADFVLHCPDGSRKNRWETREAYGAMRNALSKFALSCDPVLVDGLLLSARTIMVGQFEKPFIMAPLGQIEPNGRAMHFETISIYRFDENARLVEEWAQSDNMTLMTQLGLTLVGANA